ncbi:MAG: sigma-70 family RNA polymerase sigma factor [Acidobacteria bacterium]|uniref:Sigma-70 family RNA polymerase sigma factor n=1 Tax=Candidatus Polarisedimenticola svalbardensis TaxID=2886004 RepID=A0A8J7CCY5_9BACT|nr:sigma-70 family RNA polymerase sigma factor [Candidatus Polarisedimenticola svalbardensis]
MGDPDQSLAGQASSGDREALTALYRQHKGPLLGFLIRTLGEKPLAEDVFQEVWMKVITGIGRFDNTRGTFRAWLFRVGANAAVDRIRWEGLRRGPELDRPIDDGEGGATRVIDLVPSREPGPDREGDSTFLGQAMDRALQKLPPFQRAAILLRNQQGMSMEEIAETLGVPQGTVKSMLHRGARTLRRSLASWKRS